MVKMLFDATQYDVNSQQLDEDFDLLLNMLQQYKLNIERNLYNNKPTYIVLCNEYKWGATRCVKTWSEALNCLKPLQNLCVFKDGEFLYFDFKNDQLSQINQDRYSLKLLSKTILNRMISKYGSGTDLIYHLTQEFQGSPSKFSVPRQYVH